MVGDECDGNPEGKFIPLLNRLASIFGVPVAGGVKTQQIGGNRTFRFEGPAVTAVPFGGNLQGWSKIVAQSEQAYQARAEFIRAPGLSWVPGCLFI
jgi:hypothetical protein